MSASESGAPRRRLLFLAPFPPRLDATHGGARVTAQLIRMLAARHDVATLYLRAQDEQPADESITERCAVAEGVSIPPSASLATRVSRTLASLRGLPGWVGWTRVPAFGRRARDLAASWRPDVVHFEYHVMGQYAPALPNRDAAWILTEYEAGVLAAREHLHQEGSAGSLGARLQRRAWARYERGVIARMDAVVVFSERDRAALAPLAGTTPIVRIGLGTHLPAATLDAPASDEAPELLFVGNFKHPPNVDAAIRLVERIFPRVKAAVPAVTLRIVGAHPPARLTEASRDGVYVTGVVPDVVPHLNAATLVVVPLRLGGGMRVKVLEALAHGRAVVASPRAVEGLDVSAGVHLVLADSDDEFVSAIVGLLGAPDQRRALAANARGWAAAHLGEERWAAEYEALYARVLGQRRHAP
ncbi:MAG TPA: glycosyltransferase family 4 protein [Gemmatimonadaceae bacterium]|nr:glycosyltransferase family 4 protein [Gemmatimonadaceae bacterium]